MTSGQIYIETLQRGSGVPAADRKACEGKLVEMEQKIASLQQLIAELLTTNQQLREQSNGRD